MLYFQKVNCIVHEFEIYQQNYLQLPYIIIEKWLNLTKLKSNKYSLFNKKKVFIFLIYISYIIFYGNLLSL
jgi:hypothetical protein